MTAHMTNKHALPFSISMVALGLTSIATTCFAQTADFITMSGVVRDFRNGFPDFKLSPVGEFTHAAGVVGLSLDNAGKPIYAFGGFNVDAQWMNQADFPIAPHLFGIGPVAATSDATAQVLLVDEPAYKNDPVMDTYDPTLPYGGTNVGSAPTIVTGTSMPAIPLVPDLGPSLGTLTFNGNGTTTINSSFRCNTFHMRNKHTVQISGDITIVIENMFLIENNTDLEILPGSSLTIFSLGAASIENHVRVNYNSADHTMLTIYHASSSAFAISNHSSIYATLIAPNAMLTMQNNSDFWGSLTAYDMYLQHPTSLHIAGVAAPPAPSCFTPNDIEGFAGNTSTGSITDFDAFTNWFRTDPADNVAIAHTMTLTANDLGIFMFDAFDFTPINFRGFGNDWNNRNRNFTYEVRAVFTAESCAGHFFEFEGAGDVWIFIDGQLVLDIGGVPANGRQTIEIDRLALSEGEEHVLKLFYAQRVATVAPLHIRTNIPLRSDSIGLPNLAMLSD